MEKHLAGTAGQQNPQSRASVAVPEVRKGNDELDEARTDRLKEKYEVVD
jgi:hypothetical protein